MPTAVRYQGRGQSGVSCRTVQIRANRMLRALEVGDAELSVLLCDDATMRRLNRRYRRRGGATDVLSFAMAEGVAVAGPYRVLGDVVISLEAAARQAEERGQRVLDEVTVLLAHGLLHLTGSDHQSVAEQRRMQLQTRMLVAAARR